MEIKITKDNQAFQRKQKTENRWGDFLNRDFQLFRNTIKTNQRFKFYDELSFFISSNFDLTSALSIIMEEEKKEKLISIYKQIHTEIIKGESFSKSLEKTGHFSAYECISIQIGEESGKLTEVLSELANYFELRDQQNQQLRSSLSYPIMVLVFAIGAVAFMLQVIVPMFANVYQQFGGNLPYVTQKVVALSEWLNKYFLLITILILVVIFIPYIFRNNSTFKIYQGWVILKFPLLGRLNKLLFHARFCHTVSLLTDAQVPLVHTLELAENMISLHQLKVALQSIRKNLIGGKSFYQELQKQALFDRKLIAFTRIAEEVNQIAPVYKKLYHQYSREIKLLTNSIGKFMEPLLIIFVGFFVMIILIAMYLPMFQMSTSIF